MFAAVFLLNNRKYLLCRLRIFAAVYLVRFNYLDYF